MDTPEIYTEPWIYWLQVVPGHVEAAQKCRDSANAHSAIDAWRIGAVLAELPAAMQAITAAAFAIDGFEGAVRDIIELPAGGRPRATAIVKALAEVWELDEPERDRYRSGLAWLFNLRNQAVHGDVWKDVPWKHSSGLLVSEAQRRVGLESAERADSICRGFIFGCLSAPCRNDEIASWAALRRERCQGLL